jgi:CheY-like chemotaxis protein
MDKFNTIIIIDDNEIDTLITKLVIEYLKITSNIQSFSSAVRALEYLKLMHENTSYDNLHAPILILLDNNMPIMSGTEFLDEFNRLAIFKQKQIDILMLSADHPASLQNAVNKKCSGFIEKPLTNQKLLIQLENIRMKSIKAI